MKFRKHIFICTNERPPGEKKSCGHDCGMEIVKEFKKQLKDRGLNKQVRAQRAGCLDACEYGPSMVVYPEGVFYGGVSKEDVIEIIDRHVLSDEIVERLKIDY